MLIYVIIHMADVAIGLVAFYDAKGILWKSTISGTSSLGVSRRENDAAFALDAMECHN